MSALKIFLDRLLFANSIELANNKTTESISGGLQCKNGCILIGMNFERAKDTKIQNLNLEKENEAPIDWQNILRPEHFTSARHEGEEFADMTMDIADAEKEAAQKNYPAFLMAALYGMTRILAGEKKANELLQADPENVFIVQKGVKALQRELHGENPAGKIILRNEENDKTVGAALALTFALGKELPLDEAAADAVLGAECGRGDFTGNFSAAAASLARARFLGWRGYDKRRQEIEDARNDSLFKTAAEIFETNDAFKRRLSLLADIRIALPEVYERFFKKHAPAVEECKAFIASENKGPKYFRCQGFITGLFHIRIVLADDIKIENGRIIFIENPPPPKPIPPPPVVRNF